MNSLSFILNYFEDYEKIVNYELQGYEYDLFFPEEKLLVTFNPSVEYTDTNNFGFDKKIHQKRSEIARAYDLKCIHLFERDMNQERMDSIFGFLKPVYQQYWHVDSKRKGKGMKEAKRYRIERDLSISDFLEKYHRQKGMGKTNSFTAISEEGESLAVLNFRSARNNSQWEFELYRLCYKPNVRVFGFAERCLKMFQEDYDYPSIGSYCDLSYNICKVYDKLGFTRIGVSDPNYKWVKDSDWQSRESCQRHKLAKKFNRPEYEGTKMTTGLGEKEIMEREGYTRVFDAGNAIFKLEGKPKNKSIEDICEKPILKLREKKVINISRGY